MRRWIRLDVTWEESDWLQDLDRATAACWPRLLCMVKRDGVRGECRRPSTRRLMTLWDISAAQIASLEAAAQNDGALAIEDGQWRVLNWDKYQEIDPTNSERQRRWRERQQSAERLRVVGE
jgi:hypothetical protein